MKVCHSRSLTITLPDGHVSFDTKSLLVLLFFWLSDTKLERKIDRYTCVMETLRESWGVDEISKFDFAYQPCPQGATRLKNKIDFSPEILTSISTHTNNGSCILYKYHDQNIRQTPTCDIRNTEQLFRPYWVSAALYTIISATGDRTNNHSIQKPKLPLGHRFMSYISDAELTSHGDNARPLDLMCLEGTYSLQRTQPPPELRLPKSELWVLIT